MAGNQWLWGGGKKKGNSPGSEASLHRAPSLRLWDAGLVSAHQEVSTLTHLETEDTDQRGEGMVKPSANRKCRKSAE